MAIQEKAAGSNKRCMARKSGTEMIVLVFVFLAGGKGLFFVVQQTRLSSSSSQESGVSHEDVLCLNSPFLVMSRHSAATSFLVMSDICSSCWCLSAFPCNCEAFYDDSEKLTGL